MNWIILNVAVSVFDVFMLELGIGYAPGFAFSLGWSICYLLGRAANGPTS